MFVSAFCLISNFIPNFEISVVSPPQITRAIVPKDTLLSATRSNMSVARDSHTGGRPCTGGGSVPVEALCF